MSASPLHSIETRHAIWRMFRNCADEDYLTARWCNLARQVYPFYWNAQQALEKYLKCALLQNDVDISKFNHDIEALFSKAIDMFGDFLPLVLIPPDGLHVDRRHSIFAKRRAEPLTEFIHRISLNGDTSNRYRHFSIVFDAFDLHKLDEVCFLLRRLCFPLDILYDKSMPYRDILLSDPNFQPHTPLFPVDNNSQGFEVRLEFLKKMNFSFYSEDAYKEGKYTSGNSMENSAVFLCIESNSLDSREAIRWFMQHMKLSKPEKLFLEDFLKTPPKVVL